MKFQEELKIFSKLFEEYSREFFRKKLSKSQKYPSLIYQFYKDLFDFTSGGKKLRGFLVWLGYQVTQGPVSSFLPASARSNSKSGRGGKDQVELRAVGNPSSAATLRLKKILPIALAYELLHSFLLIHDDIIDESDIRRGRLTIHKKYEKIYGPHYGISQAIVLGDIACFEALDLVNTSGFTDSQKIACFAKIITTIIKTGYGEALDVQYSHEKTDFNNIRQMTELKTAKYTFVGSLTVGAKLGKASKSQINALSKFGFLVGLAFQIQDDILGVFGEEKITGKSALDDLCEGKNTLLIHKAKEMSRETKEPASQVVNGEPRFQRAKRGEQGDQVLKNIEELWGKRNAQMDDLKRVQVLIVDSGALTWAENEKAKLVRGAKAYIEKITGDNDLQKVFFQLADFVISRNN